MNKPTKEQTAWINSRPSTVKAVIEKCPPFGCYKSTENKGHYEIYSYEEHGGDPITIKIVHGKDSYLPGITVFGVNPNTLVKCDCGEWEPPTELQAQISKDDIEKLKEKNAS